MTQRSILLQAHRLLRRNQLAQLGLLGVFWAAGEAVARATGLPLPGGIIGMALALALFLAGGSSSPPAWPQHRETRTIRFHRAPPIVRRHDRITLRPVAPTASRAPRS